MAVLGSELKVTSEAQIIRLGSLAQLSETRTGVPLSIEEAEGGIASASRSSHGTAIEQRAAAVHTVVLRHLACSRVPSEVAEDLAQEVVVSFLRRVSAISNDGAWARTVAIRLWWREYRTRLVHVSLESGPMRVVTGLRGLEERIDLSRALVGVPPSDRRLLLLLLAGRSHSEIGGEIGVPVNQVGVRLRRAANRAARFLRDGGDRGGRERR
jgi:RNA polymerase sigma factor (sigma-70 family)